MQAILTKFIGASQTRGARIKATADRGAIVIAYNYGADEQEAHIAAAAALVAKFVKEDKARFPKMDKNPWNGKRAVGGLPNNAGYAHVFIGGAK